MTEVGELSSNMEMDGDKSNPSFNMLWPARNESMFTLVEGTEKSASPRVVADFESAIRSLYGDIPLCSKSMACEAVKTDANSVYHPID